MKKLVTLTIIMLLMMGLMLTACKSEEGDTVEQPVDEVVVDETESEEEGETEQTTEEETDSEDVQTEDTDTETGDEEQEQEVVVEKLYDTTEFYATIEEYEAATGNSITSFQQSPVLDDLVASGALPPVEDRISEEPMVMIPLNEVGTYGGRLRLAATSPVTGSAETWTMRTQPLLIVSPTLSGIAPNIAKGYAYNEDYTTLTIYLRRGMKWSDGVDFTADDFVFWYEAMLLNDEFYPVKPSLWSKGDSIVEVVKIDDYEVEFRFDYPVPSLVDSMTGMNRMYFEIPYAPAHYLQQFHIDYNEDANALAEAAGYATWLEYFTFIYPNEVQARSTVELPVLDAWVLTSVDSQGNKFFDRNPYYWKVDTAGNQLPYIEGQDRLLYENLDTINLKAVAGELDVNLQFTTAGNFTLYKENEESGNYTTYMWQDGRGSVLADMRFNLNHKDPLKNELFNDIRFRQAASLAINRDEINTVVWRGLATPRHATISPVVSFYQDWWGDYMIEYDVDRANELLDEIGLAWDSNGEFRQFSDGSTVNINLEYVEIEGDITTIVEMIKTYWEAIGIRTNIKMLDQSLYFERNDAGELDLLIWNRDSNTELGHHASPQSSAPNAIEWNLWRTSDGAEGIEPPAEYKRFWELVELFRLEPIGSEKYAEYGTEMVSIAVEQLWHIGIAGMTPKPVLINNNLRNTPVRGVLDYDYRFWMVFHPEQWYWAE